MSIPDNQMFVKFESSSTVSSKGFKAFIHKIGKLILLEFEKLKQLLCYFHYRWLLPVLEKPGRNDNFFSKLPKMV